MYKMYYLSTCSSCNKIIANNRFPENFIFQDIKTNKITESQLQELRDKTDSMEKLFSKRALKYKEMNLAEKNLTEEDYKNLILQEYTFIKRPVCIIEDRIYIGSSKSEQSLLSKHLENII